MNLLGDDMINTLRMSEELEKVGFTKDQAYKTVDTWMSIIDENLVTKSDMKELQYSVKSDVKDLRTDIEGHIKDLRTDIEGQIKDLRTDIEGQIKDLRTDIEGQIKDLRTDLEKQINELRSEVEKQKLEILIKLGSLMVTLFTISTTIISYLIIKH